MHDVANQGYELLRHLPDVSTSVVVAAALLTYIGKAHDFRRSEDRDVLSDRSNWVGGQPTILEWLAVARTQVVIPEADYLALVHAIVAARGAPENQSSAEATTLAVAMDFGMRPLGPFCGRMIS